MEIVFAEEMEYNGEQIKPNWAYEALGVKGDSIVIFVGRMNVKHVVDIEDKIKGEKIVGDRVLHFVAEHFDVQPPSLLLAYTRQRLFVTIFKDVLERRVDVYIERRGDDLYLNDKKLSVSIATVSAVSMKFHFGINIKSSGIPDFATSLEEANISEEEALEIAKEAADTYAKEIKKIWDDVKKTRTF